MTANSLRWRRRRVAPAAVLACFASLLAAGCGASGQSAAVKTVTIVTTKSSSSSKPSSFTALVARDRTGVIKIRVATCDGTATGTGFLLSPSLVATVDHVVDGASQIELLQNSSVVADGTVIGADLQRDLALVRTNTPLQGYHFTLARRAPRLGEGVAAFGFPLGLPLTVTRGSISGLDRSINIEGIERRSLVQTDAALNPGNSGGPLISTDTDDVVGLVDAKNVSASGIGFAVSAAVAEPLLAAWRVSPQPIPSNGCNSGALAAPGPTQTASPSPPVSVNAAVQVVYMYWSFLQLGEIANAYALFSSAEKARVGGLQTYVNGISQDPPQQVNVQLSQGDVSGDTATVVVDSLQTLSSSGCANWTGSYRLVYASSVWQIDEANLSKSSC